MFFGGGEIGSHRTLLTELGVKNIALSYVGLSRRVKFAKPWRIADKFDPAVSVFLDAGAYTINKDDDKFENPNDITEVSDRYQKFVLDNIDAVDMVSEFDAMPLGHDWIYDQRVLFYDELPREKFMPIWHAEWGVDELYDMAKQYERIGILTTTLNGRNLSPVLNALSARGTRLHGVAMTKIETMQGIRWDTVASTSWISPAQFGDTIVWTGKELKRYPKKYKDEARKRHRTLFTSNGFDAAKIEDPDDKTEVLRLSVWSWLKFEENVNKHHKPGLSHSYPEVTEVEAVPRADPIEPLPTEEFVLSLMLAGKNPPRGEISDKQRERYYALRDEVYAEYGNECVCCGVKDKEFLSIDHVFDDGGGERNGLYARMKSLGFPKDRYQLLCLNCNIGRYRNGGVCPHKHHKPDIRVTHPFSDSEAPNVESGGEVVAHTEEKAGKELTTTTPRETSVLPGLGFMRKTNDEGEEEENSPTLLHVRGESARVCNSCFLAEKCPAYEPDSTCAYSIPITVRTREEMRALQYGLIEMQAQRVMFMQFIEDKEGGYVDPNLSKEMALLDKLMGHQEKSEREGFDVSVRVRGSSDEASAGVISRMFGQAEGSKVMRLEQGPVLADDIIDADFTETTSE